MHGVPGRRRLPAGVSRSVPPRNAPVFEAFASIQRTGDITNAGACATETYRELGRGLRIGGDGAEPADHVPDRGGADWIEQVPAQSPRQSLIPIQRHYRRVNARPLRQEARGAREAGK